MWIVADAHRHTRRPRSTHFGRLSDAGAGHKQSEHGQLSGEQRSRAAQTPRNTPQPAKKVLQLHESLTKRQSALLVHLRTEKIGLRHFLFARRLPGITSSRYQCGERRQTVALVLLRCRKLRNLRNQAFGNLPGRHNLQTILSKPQLATKAIQFIEQAQILGLIRIADA